MPPRVIGHRGAPGHRPDHTLEGYALALSMGADVIEPDLVATKDGVLVARHENDLSHTTDVAERFPERLATKTIDGRVVTGFFTEDFTLAELRTLFARQPMPGRSKAFDGRCRIPTFDEILDLVDDWERRTGRRVGVEPETKHPSWFRSLGLPLEPPLVAALAARGLDDGRSEVWVQSFETANLRELFAGTSLRLLRLFDTRDLELLTVEGLPEVASFAHGIGVHKSHLVADDGSSNDLVARAHALGLEVHVYTFRNEPDRIAPWADGDPVRELRAFAELGVDAVFADFPDTAYAALRAS